jgi:hypothetical protein
MNTWYFPKNPSSAISAMLWNPPAATAVTPLRPGGTLAWPWSFSPQATTVPSSFSARPWNPPAEMAVTPLRPG